MHDDVGAPVEHAASPEGSSQPTMPPQKEADVVVSTHVLVGGDQVEQLRELSRRTRVAQSEYLREAVDDLLIKYGKLEAPKE
jgi:Ribbon-helix-helix domain